MLEKRHHLHEIGTAFQLHVGQRVEKNEVEYEECQEQRFEKTAAVAPHAGDGAQDADDCKNPNVSAGAKTSVTASHEKKSGE